MMLSDYFAVVFTLELLFMFDIGVVHIIFVYVFDFLR